MHVLSTINKHRMASSGQPTAPHRDARGPAFGERDRWHGEISPSLAAIAHAECLDRQELFRRAVLIKPAKVSLRMTLRLIALFYHRTAPCGSELVARLRTINRSLPLTEANGRDLKAANDAVEMSPPSH